MKAKKQQPQLTITAQLKDAFKKWMGGVRRKDLATELHTTRPKLRQAFVAISGKKWKDLSAERKAAVKGKKSKAA